jgi:dTDP-4-amino-4,6-dideoxygalactose transaminase
MTSVNLPDMVQLIREHGLIPVPLDLDPRTMGPVSLEKMKELITPKVSRSLTLLDKSFYCSLHLWSEV